MVLLPWPLHPEFQRGPGFLVAAVPERLKQPVAEDLGFALLIALEGPGISDEFLNRSNRIVHGAFNLGNARKVSYHPRKTSWLQAQNRLHPTKRNPFPFCRLHSESDLLIRLPRPVRADVDGNGLIEPLEEFQ